MTKIELKNPNALVSTEWLARNLGDPNLRVFDCSTVLKFEKGGKRPYRVVSCKDEHENGHIPGAGFFDLQGEFSIEDSPFGMTLADPGSVAAAFARHGIDKNSRVVLYSRRSMSWATRFWWMLRWLGFDRASVLNGGFEKWVAEELPLSTAPCSYPPGQLTVNIRPGSFVGKTEVLAAIDDPETSLVNALGRDIFSGENPRYGRPGRIPGSVNIPQTELVDPETLAFRPLSEIRAAFAVATENQAVRHITYCGGGIFATVNAFWLYQLGYETVSVYENSMSEWGPDPSLPIESD